MPKIKQLKLYPPSDITVTSSDGNPVSVTYPAAKTTGGRAPVVITYSNPSGSLFPIGNTSVSIVAKSKDGQTVAGGFIISVNAVTPPPPPPGKTVLNPATDLVLLGVIRPPDDAGTQPKAMTSRVVNGEFRLIHWSSSGIAPALEWTPGDYTPSTSNNYFAIPQGITKRTYLPNIYGTYGGFGWEPGSHTTETVDDMKQAFIKWVESERALYYGFTSYYNGDTSGSCLNIGRTVPNADESSWATQGLWFTDYPLPAGFGNRWCTAMTELPSWLAAIFGGRTLAIGGGGGYWQGIFSNNISQGPTFFPMSSINPAGQPYGEKLASSPIPITFHPYYAPSGLSPVYPNPYNNMYAQSPRIGRRPVAANPINKYGNPNNTNPYPGAPDDPWLPDPPANGGRYYYTTSDQNHAMCFVDGPNLHGLLYAATIASGSADTRVRGIAFAGTDSGGRQYYTMQVDSTVGILPNMFMYLEDAASPHYGGWLCQVQHFLNTGPYNTNLGDGNTNNPILDSTHVMVYNFEESVWTPTITGDNKFCAGQWYGGGGGKSPTFETWVASYDPNDLPAQLNVSDNDYSRLEPKYWGKKDYTIRRESIYSAAAVPGCTSIEIDYINHKAYFNVMGGDLSPAYNAFLPLVYVYNIPNL